MTANAVVDDQSVYQSSGELPIDEQGMSLIRFQLPQVHRSSRVLPLTQCLFACSRVRVCSQQMVRGEGTLTVSVQDGGVVESSGKTIPILLQAVDVRVYPEGEPRCELTMT